MSEIIIYEALFSITENKNAGLNFYKSKDGLIIESWVTGKPIRRIFITDVEVALKIIPILRKNFEDKELESLKEQFILDLEDPELKELKKQFIIEEKEMK